MQPGADDGDETINNTSTFSTTSNCDPTTSTTAATATGAFTGGSSSNGNGSPELATTPDADLSALEKHIQNADAFIIMYSVTDQCSFEDCTRLRFLINYNNKQRRRSITKDCALDIPVILVGNKKDQKDDRMVDVQQGKRMYREMSCAGFHEISVRESADEVWNVFRDLCRCWRIFTHYPKLKRSTSDAQTISYMLLSPDIGANGMGGSGGGHQHHGATTSGYFDGWLRNGEKRQSFFGFRSNGGGGSSSSSQQSPSVEDVNSAPMAGPKKLSIRLPYQQQQSLQLQQQQQHHHQQPFRERASTDGKILSRPRKWQYITAANSTTASAATHPQTVRVERRMSISQRGSSGN